MIGREACHNPFILADADRRFFNLPASVHSRLDIARGMIPYITDQLQKGVHLHRITRHMLGLYNGMPGARYFRRTLAEAARKKTDGITHYQSILDDLTPL